MEKKKCFKCGQVKSLNDYYAHPMMGDGHLNKCKECTKKDSTKRRNNNLEECREYDRKRGDLPHRVKARKDYDRKKREENPEEYKRRKYKYTKKYREKNPKKRNANSRLNYHVANGDIKKEKCKVCGDPKVEAHHPDYDYPLSVTWLCDKHHKEEHKKMKQNKREVEVKYKRR